MRALAAALSVYIPLAMLLLLLCWRVWDIGVTHTDDAWWVLRSHASLGQAGADWAAMQGRLWAYVAGALIMLALHWQGTVAGELLRLGSFVLFFGALHVAVAVYCTRRVALLSATLFVAFFALKWDGSILTAYPLITWPAGIACVGALLLGRAYMGPGQRQRRWQLGVAAALLLFALFNNEGVTVTCIALALLSVRANLAQGGDRRRAGHLLRTFVAVAALYAVLYLGWRQVHPTLYEGNSLAPFDLQRSVTTLLHFSTSGSVLHDWFAPVSMVYADPFGGAARITYALAHDWRGLAAARGALLAGALAAWLLWRQLRLPLRATPAGPLRCAIAAGLVLALLPIVPVALVVSYQQWVMELQVRAYSHTILAHFGWSIALAAVLAGLAQRCGHWRLYGLLLLALAGGSGVLAALAYRANDAIALTMRPEAGRWSVVNRAVPLNQALFRSPVLWIPALATRTPYGSLPDRYWSDYAKARFGVATEVGARIPDINDLVHGVAMLDYGYDPRARRMVALMMQYRKDGLAGAYLPGRIAVDLDGAAAGNYVLQFRRAGVAQQRPVAALTGVAGRAGLYLLDGAGIDPASVQLRRAGEAGAAGVLCAIRLPHGLRIDFGVPRMARPALDPRSLLHGAWHAPDAAGIWSGAGALRIVVPPGLLPDGPVTLELDAASYTSIGFYNAAQHMKAKVNGVAVGAWDFGYARTPTVRVDLPAQGALVLDMQVGPAMNPRQLGVSGDARDLGLRLHALMLLPPAGAGP